MKKKELKKRIEDGFSQLAPDVFETVMEAAEEQNIVWSQLDFRQPGEQKRRGIRHKYAISFCACLAMICVCIFGMFSEKQGYVYMVLDINPSIEVEVNEFRQVENLKGLNQDGKDVVKELKWKKKEPVQDLLDVLIQDVVEKSYLRDNEGILVTLSAASQDICENLESALGEGIDRKLKELKVSGVTTAFRQAKSRSGKEGRKLLETELVKCSDLNEEQAQQLSVRELIQYCQDYTSLELKVSGSSSQTEEEQPQQKKEETQTPLPISSGDGEKQETEEKKQEEKKQEEKEAEKKEATESETEQISEGDESEKKDSRNSTGSGNTQVQNDKKNMTESSSKQDTPAKTEEQTKVESSGNQEVSVQPDNSEEQEDAPEPENSGEQEDVPKPEESGDKENMQELDNCEGDEPSKLENSEGNGPFKSESSKGNETSKTESPEEQEDVPKPENSAGPVDIIPVRETGRIEKGKSERKVRG